MKPRKQVQLQTTVRASSLRNKLTEDWKGPAAAPEPLKWQRPFTNSIKRWLPAAQMQDYHRNWKATAKKLNLTQKYKGSRATPKNLKADTQNVAGTFISQFQTFL